MNTYNILINRGNSVSRWIQVKADNEMQAIDKVKHINPNIIKIILDARHSTQGSSHAN